MLFILIMEQLAETFSKKERLCGIKAIDELFDTGRTFQAPLFRAVCSIEPAAADLASVRLLVSVAKKHFRKAVDRNLLRRRIKEAYRKHKNLLVKPLTENNKRADIAIIWKDQVIADYREIEISMLDILSKIARQV